MDEFHGRAPVGPRHAANEADDGRWPDDATVHLDAVRDDGPEPGGYEPGEGYNVFVPWGYRIVPRRSPLVNFASSIVLVALVAMAGLWATGIVKGQLVDPLGFSARFNKPTPSGSAAPAPLNPGDLSNEPLAWPEDGYTLAEPPGDITNELAVTRFLESTGSHISQVWSAYFKESSPMKFVGFAVVRPGWAYENSDCNIPLGSKLVTNQSTDNSIVLCRNWGERGSNGVFLVPQLTVQRLWDPKVVGFKGGHKGGFAAAVVLAYRYTIPVLEKMAQGFQLPKIEDVADRRAVMACLTGTWARVAFHSGINLTVVERDVDAAMAGIALLAEGEKAAAGKFFKPAFATGYASGKPRDCVKQLWPNAGI